MSLPLDPIPNDAALVDPREFLITRRWYIWLYNLWLRVKTLVAVAGTPIAKSNQNASIVAGTAYTVTQSGLYRVSYRMRVTTPGTVSSSLTATIGWREGGVTQSQSGAAMTGNTTATQQNGTVFVRADSGTLITYGFAYASVGATVMVYAADVAVELVN